MHSKPISKIVRDDLLAHPIWEYATGDELEGDETYVYPYAEATVPADPDDHQVYHVACDIKTAQGRELIGFMSLTGGQLHDVVPAVAGRAEAEEFTLECPPHRRERAAFEAFMGAPFEALFPVSWRLRVLVGQESTLRSGVYEGRS